MLGNRFIVGTTRVMNFKEPVLLLTHRLTEASMGPLIMKNLQFNKRENVRSAVINNKNINNILRMQKFDSIKENSFVVAAEDLFNGVKEFGFKNCFNNI